MTLLFHKDASISKNKRKLILEILKTNKSEVLKEMYWLIKNANEEDEELEEDMDDEDSGFFQYRRSA